MPNEALAVEELLILVLDLADQGLVPQQISDELAVPVDVVAQLLYGGC